MCVIFEDCISANKDVCVIVEECISANKDVCVIVEECITANKDVCVIVANEDFESKCFFLCHVPKYSLCPSEENMFMLLLL